MHTNQRKKISVIHKYAEENFSEGDWYTLGQITGRLELIQEHHRLLRSMGFGDEDYDYCVAEIINQVCEEEPELIEIIIDHFDIDLWYEQKDKRKFKKIFSDSVLIPPDFWKKGDLKAFISHLAQNKLKVTSLKNHLEPWGITSFVAHEDIEPSREWMVEIEKALSTMDLLIALIEPEFRESNWTDQEVGFALGRNIAIISLRAGSDPYGFMGKYQGIQVKGKLPEIVAQDIVKVLLKKTKYSDKLLFSISKNIRQESSATKIEKIKLIDSWEIISNEQFKTLLENGAISEAEKNSLLEIIKRCGAFQVTEIKDYVSEDVPF
jgi:AbiJ-like protein/TIR domain-containing protein